MPVWHVSVASQGPPHRDHAEPIAADDLTTSDFSIMAGHARRLLAGVGQDEGVWHIGPSAIHLRRKVTDAELAELDPAWRAIPAVDLGGDYPEWTPPD